MFENSDNNEPLFSALQHLKHKKHEVILFHVTDKEKEFDFNFENRPYKFIDMESGEELKLNASEVKQNYIEAITKVYDDIKLKCAQYKIDFIEADINQGFEHVLNSYLIKRNLLSK